PLLFSGVGYPSVRGGASQPWFEDRTRGLDLQEQAAAYEATFRAFCSRPWLRGMFWWKWPSNGLGGGQQDASYTPRRKPAEEIVRACFPRLARDSKIGPGQPPRVRHHPPGRHPPHFISFRRLWNYFAFCLLQEVALQSLLNNRLMALVENRWLSSLLAGAIFGALHWPNPVLVPVTFVGGVGMAWLFAQQRNIIPFAVGQALLGSLVWWVFPLSWHHGLRVGRGYYGLWLSGVVL